MKKIREGAHLMSKKNKNPAIIKRDTVDNWSKSTYIPAENVIIIMDKKDGGVKVMIGDGETNVNDLSDILQFDKKFENTKKVENGVLIV